MVEELDKHSYFDFLQAEHSLDHFRSLEMSIYLEMLNICQNNGISKVYDIGCGFGWQSEIFKRGGVNYTGVEVNPIDFWKPEVDGVNFIIKKYPFQIDVKPNEAVISNMCLSWGCYLDDENTLKKQVEAVNRDFDQAILCLSKENARPFIKSFDQCKILQDDTFSKFVYLSNLK